MEKENKELFYKQKYFKYKYKYINQKNNLHGGLTLKSGLYAYFCNAEHAENNGIKFIKGGKTLSIFYLNNIFSMNGLRLENNTNMLTLIISNATAIKNGLKSVGEVVKPALFIGAVIAGVVILPIAFLGAGLKAIAHHGGNDKVGTGLPAEIKLENITSFDENNYTEKLKPILDDLNPKYKFGGKPINCCLVIKVNPFISNEFKGIIKL